MSFPIVRLRRLRHNSTLRSMLSETKISMDDLVYPLFIHYGENHKKEISSMPGQFQLSVDMLEEEVKELKELGVKAVILFGIPEKKDKVGSGAYDKNGIVQKATRKLKELMPELFVITDVCLCEYTSHGHCGLLNGEEILNDETLPLLQQTAVSQAIAGADMVAPSDMMDGRVGAIREALDDAGFANTPIMSYAAKYASAYYGPFRDAADSTPAFGDRKSHQMNPANSDEAMREVEEDIIEGADMVMVKPASAYLDIIRRVKDSFAFPTAAYAVSGEYSMIEAAVANGWLDKERIVYEHLISIKRAGADMIISYHTKFVAELIKDGRLPV